ncbi:MAG: hypothetical protein AAFQ88_04665 [Pseudomonadota bacterium]
MASNDPGSRETVSTSDRMVDHPFDAPERAVLDIARRFFGTFATPQDHAWISAFASAQQCFGGHGPAIAMRTVTAIQALRASRTAAFSFINPDCPCCRHRITTEERYFLAILHAVRRGRRSDAVLNAIFVCGGEDYDLLVAAMERVAAAMPVIDAGVAQPVD